MRYFFEVSYFPENDDQTEFAFNLTITNDQNNDSWTSPKQSLESSNKEDAGNEAMEKAQKFMRILHGIN